MRDLTGRVSGELPERRARLHAAPASVRRRWRRSLQQRVTVTTVLLCGVVVIVIGLILLTQIRDQILKVKRTAAIAQSINGLQYAESQLAAVDAINGDDVRTTLDRTRQQLAERGGPAGRFDVVMFVGVGDDAIPIARLNSLALSVPPELRAEVQGGVQSYQLATVDFGDGGSGKALLVGSPIPSSIDDFELYYLFPLDQEETSLALIQGTVLLSGIALVLLVGGIGATVARLVVRPVRDAARTAERLASGRLEDRMRVRGEDDLAVLATSFNDMAASLQLQIRQLEQLSRLQQRFTSDVSHELRTPLTTVRMAADVLYASREDFPPAVARSTELLQAEVNRFEALLNDLLEISRYDAGAAVLEAEPTDLRALVDRVCAATHSVAARQGSELVVAVGGPVVMAEADPRRVERIVRNLIVNAVEHGEGLPVEIAVAGDGHAAAITVRDHGIGLKPGEAAQVFSRFWRADPSRSKGLGGTGLGLSISLEDARLHGGWLQAWGEPGHGAQFRLTLPIRSGAELTHSPLPLSPQPRLPATTAGERA
ncbi:MAG: HAMP domain-containing protein [Geodermatophilaceae bacterium]|nr:HAMP domain-containing protein [Geodermatophilaceae bacterium]MDQ3466121.1 MtrAB system histidine kinase MtrB [Actinomycetota bacterium]